MTSNDTDLPVSASTAPFAIDVLLIDGFALMSLAAALEPFRAANTLSGRTLYRWRHLAVDGVAARASNGLVLAADGGPGAGSGVPADLVMVIAGGDPSRFADPAVLAWLRRTAREGTVIAGVSGGPWVLARAGLLDGRRATIHWEHQAAFREAFPAVDLHPSLFVIDGARVTCAGGTAGLDMAVELIGRAQGRAFAARVADWFVSTSRRSGEGSQRFGLGERYGVASQPLLDALALMETAVEEPVSRAALARRAGVSVRQLERLFAAQLGSSIARTYRAIRLDHAARLVRATQLPVGEIAAACGFASAAHFSRVFRAAHGLAPGMLRQRHLRGDL
jgi:transcriptional regulator GlxA family with amidase domain